MLGLDTDKALRAHAMMGIGSLRSTPEGRARLSAWDSTIAVASTELVADVLEAVERRGGRPLVVVATPDGFIHWVEFTSTPADPALEPVDVATTINMGMLVTLLRQRPGELVLIRSCEPLGARITDGGPSQLLRA